MRQTSIKKNRSSWRAGLVGAALMTSLACSSQAEQAMEQPVTPSSSSMESARSEASVFDHIPNLTPPGEFPPPIIFPDVPYVPTPEKLVEIMLEMAGVEKGDLVYDLGSGDGRIPIMAAKRYGAKAVGVEINPNLVSLASENAAAAGVDQKVSFIHEDLFDVDFSQASVVTLYLLPEVNMKLRPRLLRELKPGTRIVSHAFDMGEWQPEQVKTWEGRTVYYWTVPESVPEHLK